MLGRPPDRTAPIRDKGSLALSPRAPFYIRDVQHKTLLTYGYTYHDRHGRKEATTAVGAHELKSQKKQLSLRGWGLV